MSLYFSSGQVQAAQLGQIARELESAGKQRASKSGEHGWLWVDDDPARFGPAFDPYTGVTVVASGRLCWSSAEWEAAARLHYEGGLACRLILERYLVGGVERVTPYNGAAVLLIIDPRTEESIVWTDQFGYHPCYAYREEDADRCVVTTFPDLLLADSTVSLTDDLVSMAEFLSAWRVTPPHTYFNEVRHVGAAMRFTVDHRAKKVHKKEYWRPFEDGFFSDISTAAEALSHAVRESIKERTAVATRPLFFVSGGADSRVMLFNSSNRAAVTGVNLYERPAAELEIARKLCKLAGSQFVSLQRDNDFYPRNLAEIVKWSGAMWSAEDSHYPGFEMALAHLKPDLVMTACTTDWVFKAYGMEKEHRKLFGRNLPLFKYAAERVQAFLPNIPEPPPAKYKSEIERRFAEWFSACPVVMRGARDRLRVEDRRVRPTAYAVSVSGSIMYRKFPYDNFLADSRVADCYSKTHPDWKLNRELWGRVAAILCGEAGDIVDANYGWRVDASTSRKIAAFAVGWVTRRLNAPRDAARKEDDRPPSAGSWPDFGWYAAHSPTVKRLWNSVNNEERERMAAVCGFDPFQKSASEWAANGHHLCRILTLLSHWRESRDRSARSRLQATPDEAYL